MMGLSPAHLRGRLGNRGLAAAAGLLVVLVVLFATPQLLGTRVAAAFGTLDQADAKWLWLAGVGFALAVVGAVAGFVPLWPLLVALTLVAAAVAATLRARSRPAAGRVSHLLDAFRALGRRPSGAVRIVTWVALSTAGRLAAATAVGAALGIHRPLAAAVVIVPALDIAGLVPLTPGNMGVTSGAIALAFQAHGTSFTHGLAAGIAFHAVETAVGLMFGLASLVWLAPYPTPGVRRVALLATAASWSVGIAGAFSATVLVPLV